MSSPGDRGAVGDPTTTATAPTPAQAVDFFTLLAKLKTTPRTGWVRRGIPHPESIADHMYRMGLMALVAGMECVLLALAHDVAEAIVGDIAPGDGVSKADKADREAAAMEEIGRMLGGGPVAARLGALFAEYEAGETPEAVLVKDLDKVEMVLQAGEYERAAAAAAAEEEGGGAASTVPPGPRLPLDLSEFFDSVRGRLATPVGAAWMAEAEARRPPVG